MGFTSVGGYKTTFKVVFRGYAFALGCSFKKAFTQTSITQCVVAAGVLAGMDQRGKLYLSTPLL